MPNFQGGGAYDAVMAEMAQRQAAQRQQTLDSLAMRQGEQGIAASKQGVEASKAAVANTTENTASLIAGRTEAAQKAEQAQIMETLKTIDPDAEVPADLAARMKKAGLSHLLDEGQAAAAAVPDMSAATTAVPQALPGGGIPSVIAPAPVAPAKVTYKGTPDQRRVASFLKDPNIPDEAKEYVRATGDPKTIPYQLLQGEQTKPVVRVSNDKRGMEIFKSGKWEPVTGEIPKDAQLIMENQDKSQNGGQPYFIPIQTAQGFQSFNARTGRIEGRLGDLRPGETAQTQLAQAQSVAYQLEEIRKTFKPENVGPLTGRYKTMQLALAGELGDEGLADFQTSVQRLGNTVIQLRTGAQMSEQEADRILKEVPSMNLPPDVFLARLGKADEYFKDWMTHRAKLAFGRTTIGDVTNMVTTGSATPPPAGPEAAPAAAPKVRKYNPATGKIE